MIDKSKKRKSPPPFSIEHRRRISETCKKNGIGKWALGNINCLGKHWKVKDTSKMKGHVPWSKGKTGVYSEETIRKIREASLGNKNLLGYRFSSESKIKMSKSHIGKKRLPHSEETKKKIGLANRIQDRTKLVINEKKHLDGRYREWMFGVKNRDNWACRIADINCEGRLEAHHILNWKDYPELRYEINNGITLCHAHHPRKRKDEAKLSPYFQQLVAEMK